jgi:hypothetical protein
VDILQAIVGWLRSFIGVEAKVKEHPPLERYEMSDRVLVLLFDHRHEGFPGLVSLWLCESANATRGCLILCANLAELREWIFRLREHEKETPEQTQWRRSLEIKARAVIREQAHVSGTHLVIVASVSRVDERGYRHLECVGAWIVDLVGIHTYYPKNRIAQLTIRAVAMKVLKIKDGPQVSWESVLFDYDDQHGQPWLYWIEEFSRKLMRSPTHVIQPPKPRRNRES